MATNHQLILTTLLLVAAHCRAEVYTVTAYCPCAKCCGRYGAPTASGRRPQSGHTIAAPRAIPFGTRLHIEGVGWRVVEDRLARRFDKRIDVFMDSHREAVNFGKRRLEVHK